jgi:uncharacterized protein with NRDE domain
VCFILALLGAHEQYPLVLAANRDERRARPSRPPFRWPSERIVAGRDEVAGGTWLGVSDRGMVAAITNRRDAPIDPARPSRGALCPLVLAQPSVEAGRVALAVELAERPRNPFHLLCADAGGGWVATWRGDVQALDRGAHVLTNRGALDDPALPVVQRARALLDPINVGALSLEPLLAALGALCADGQGPDPICRVGGEYGTVSSSLIALGQNGRTAAYWHAEGPPSEAPYRPVPTGASAPV